MKNPEKKGKKRSILKGLKFTTVIGMIFALMMIPMTLGYLKAEITAETEPDILGALIVLVFLVTSLARLMRARRMRLQGKPKSKYVMQRVYALAFLVCAVLPFFLPYYKEAGFWANATGKPVGWCGDVRQAVGLVFWCALIAGRIVSIVRDHRLRRIVVNVLLILLMAMAAVGFCSYCDISVALVVSVALTLGDIFTVVFARIHMDTLMKIVRKTYATEIILGLLLLIFAFSYVLEFCEEGIGSFPDALWYCFAIVTTIGFGDITASSIIGRLLSVVLGIYGIIVVALITSIIVNFYSEVKREPEEPEEPGEDGEAWNTSSKS